MRLILFIVLMLAGMNALAGGCPYGYVEIYNPDVLNCAPIPGVERNENSSVNSSNNYTPPDPGPMWEKRWGAIAVGAGYYGAMEEMKTARSAEKAAIKECTKNGGKKCRVVASYYNQCGALAWGDNRYVGYRGPIRETTEKDAVNVCNQQTANCKVSYSGCSYPRQK